MERIQTLEILLHTLSRCHTDNGINILMIDGVSEKALECIESFEEPFPGELEELKASAIRQLGSIPDLVKQYKKSYDRHTRTGDPVIHQQCLARAEQAINSFIRQLAGAQEPVVEN